MPRGPFAQLTMVRSWSEVGNKVPRMDPEKKVEEKRTLRLSNAVYYPPVPRPDSINQSWTELVISLSIREEIVPVGPEVAEFRFSFVHANHTPCKLGLELMPAR